MPVSKLAEARAIADSWLHFLRANPTAPIDRATLGLSFLDICDLLTHPMTRHEIAADTHAKWRQAIKEARSRTPAVPLTEKAMSRALARISLDRMKYGGNYFSLPAESTLKRLLKSQREDEERNAASGLATSSSSQ